MADLDSGLADAELVAAVQSSNYGALNVRSFGAVGDGVADDTAAIQAAIDQCLEFSLYKEVFIPAGTYLISDTIHMGYEDYDGIHLIGGGNVYKAESNIQGTVIVPTFKDRPAIAIQSCRGSRVSKLSIKGYNFDYINSNNFMAEDTSFDDTDVAIWNDPSDKVTEGQFNPYAGIAIDPYCGVRPDPVTDGYPDVTYPSFVFDPTQYGKVGGSDVVIDDVSIMGFNVGVALQPCNHDANGDFIRITNSTLAYNTYGFSAGNTQTRQLGFADSMFQLCHTAMTTVTHGLQKGKGQGVVSNVNFDRTILMFNLNTDYGVLNVIGGYSELAYQVCEIGTDSGNKLPINFIGCEFALSAQMTAQRGRPVHEFNGEGGVFIIDGGSITVPDGLIMTCNDSSAMKIAGMKGHQENLPTTTAEAIAFNACQNSIAPSEFMDVQVFHKNYDVDTFATRGDFITSIVVPVGADGRNITFSKHVETEYTLLKDWKVKDGMKLLDTVSWTGIVVTGKVVTVDIGTTEQNVALYGVDLGDIIYKDDTYYYVSARAGTVIDLTALNNYDMNEALRSPLTAGGYASYWHSRKYLLDDEEYSFSITSGSAVANVARGRDGYLGELASKFIVGDRLYIVDGLQTVFGTTAMPKIVSVDDVAGTVTFDASASRDVVDLFIIFMSRTESS